jgi:PAS domain S-box-containing protein
MHWSFSIRTRLIILVFVAVAPFLGLALYDIYITDPAQIRREVQANILNLARLQSARIDDHLHTAAVFLEATSVELTGYTADIAANDAFLRAEKAELPLYYESIDLYSLAGQNLGTSLDPIGDHGRLNLTSANDLLRITAHNGLFFGTPIISPATGEWVIRIARPLAGPDGRIRAALSVTLNLDRLQAIIDPVGLPPDSATSLVNDQGVVLARSPDPISWVGRDIRNLPKFERAQRQGEGAEEFDGADGVPRLYGYATLSRAPWIAYVGIPSAIAFADIQANLQRELLWGSLALLLTLALAWLLAERIARPLRQLALEARALGSGDLTRRMAAPTSGEIGILALAFNQMAVALERTSSAQRQSEAAMQAQRDFALQVMNTMGQGLVVINTAGHFEFVNPAFARMLDYQPAALIGRPPFDVVFPEDHARLARFLEQQRDDETITDEMRLRRADGGANYALITVVPRRQGATIIGMIAVITDLTERQRAEAALRESQQRLSAIIISAMDGIITIDADQCIVLFNQAAERIFGYRASEIAGQPFDRLIPEGDRATHQQHIAAFGRTGVPNRRMGGSRAFSGRRANGEIFPIEASISQTVIAAQTFYTIILRDVTKYKQLEAQYLQAQKMESVGLLAGGIAHDFNNMLTGILGYLELGMLALPSESTVRNDLDEARKAAERAGALTHQLLAFASKQIIEPRVIDLTDLVRDIDNLLRRLISSDIELITLLAPNLGRVNVDPGQIEQVIVNLVVNARDAMPDGGKLMIATTNVVLDADFVRKHVGATAGAFVQLTISDTGVGIDDEVKQHLFEPFFTTKAPEKGTGLGLATCYGIVKQHGGSIWVDSVVGRGTTFTIYLPQVEQPAEAHPQRIDTDALPQGTQTPLLGRG